MAERDLQSLAFPKLDESQIAKLARCTQGSLRRYPEELTTPHWITVQQTPRQYPF